MPLLQTAAGLCTAKWRLVFFFGIIATCIIYSSRGGNKTVDVKCSLASVEFALIFSHYVILQRNEPVRVWGWAPRDCPVKLDLISEKGSVRARGCVVQDGFGLWIATIAPQPGGSELFALVASTPNGIATRIENVQFGVVLACLGQSNIARSGVGSVGSALAHSFELEAATKGLRAELENIPLPVRYFGAFNGPYPELWHTNGNTARQPDFSRPLGVPWTDTFTLNDAVLQNCSSTCWLTGRGVAAKLGGTVPVGLIDAAVGGSAIQAWSSAEALHECGSPAGAPSDFVAWAPGAPGALFNALVSPLAVGPLTLGGVFWYNGETNSLFQEAKLYACLLPALLRDLRTEFKAPALWFAVVELHPFFIYDVASAATADLRGSQQAAAAALPGVTLVPAVDLGDATNNLHPLGLAKVRLAERLALAYDRAQRGEFNMGPRYARALPRVSETSGACGLGVVVEFAAGSIGGGGLEWREKSAERESTRCPEEEGVDAIFCDGLSMQDSDGEWHSAKVTVTSGAAVVELSVAQCKAGLRPVATRNGWAGWPVVQLYDAAGFPVHPWPPTPLDEEQV